MRIGLNFQAMDKYFSGVEYYSLGLLNGLLRIDTENTYIVFTNQPDLVREHVPQHTNLSIVEVKYLKTRTARICWEHTQLPRLSAKHKLNVLHCPSYICPLRKQSIPYVVTIHDTIAIDHPQWCKKMNALYFNLFMKAAAKKASRIISVSEHSTDDIKRNFNLPCSKIRTIYPGIDNIFNSGENPSHCSEVGARYNLPQRYILYVGNIEPKKNIVTLLHVTKKLREKGLPHKLVIVGKRTWESEAELEEISHEIAAGNVVCPGYVDRNDLPYVYQMADVFVFPSLYEGFGFPPLEAMACGTPVISTSSGALAETVKGAALIVKPNNIHQITNAICSMIKDSRFRERYTRMGLERSGRFNWDRAAEQTLSVYREVSATNGRQR
jgi:glycosyltransferase involved in cell wall biosynthesis